MSATALAISAVERTPIPDAVTRGGVAFLVSRARGELGKGAPSDAAFAAEMARYPDRHRYRRCERAALRGPHRILPPLSRAAAQVLVLPLRPGDPGSGRR